MDRINQILYHPLFQQYMKANAAKETDRIFCKHNMEHAMDVARIAYILALEEAAGCRKDVIYGAALLHDIGRHIQYETGEKHALASARLALEILADCGYEEKEVALIAEAIKAHSSKEDTYTHSLKDILARADKLSRACYSCKAREACNWSGQKKNHQIIL